MDIKDIVIDCVRNTGKYASVVDESTALRGDSSPLDSLAFVGLMVAIETFLCKVTGKDWQIFKPEHFLGKVDNPYKTVGSLITFINTLCGKDVPQRVVGHKVKIIFTDLDGTLWEGISGEGEVKYIDGICNELRRLYSCGVLIALVTKNYKDIVDNELRGIVPLRNMFVVEEYNVFDKADCIRDVCERLNINSDSAVFLDDDQHERDRVRSALPMVWVPDNHMDIAAIDIEKVTYEDRNRTAMYKQEYERARTRPRGEVIKSSDYMSWLASLNMVLSVKTNLTVGELARACELIERSNQFNFSKSVPLQKFDTYVFSLADKFGEMGIIATANLTEDSKIHNFCVSCRALGRGVEYTIMQIFTAMNAKVVPPVDSGKNKAAMDFWSQKDSFTKYPIKVIWE